MLQDTYYNNLRTQEKIKKGQQIVQEQILQQMRNVQMQLNENFIAMALGRPIPYPELTGEYQQKKIKDERQTYMYGYGLSFQDDREQKAFQKGELLL